uniref:Herpes_ori_bp domain-containing protein n=1 Tax=Panagrellus redivivus TaxID=6233 RepID=A0A7E4ZV19_PANRE
MADNYQVTEKRTIVLGKANSQKFKFYQYPHGDTTEKLVAPAAVSTTSMQQASLWDSVVTQLHGSHNVVVFTDTLLANLTPPNPSIQVILAANPITPTEMITIALSAGTKHGSFVQTRWMVFALFYDSILRINEPDIKQKVALVMEKLSTDLMFLQKAILKKNVKLVVMTIPAIGVLKNVLTIFNTSLRSAYSKSTNVTLFDWDLTCTTAKSNTYQERMTVLTECLSRLTGESFVNMATRSDNDSLLITSNPSNANREGLYPHTDDAQPSPVLTFPDADLTFAERKEHQNGVLKMFPDEPKKGRIFIFGDSLLSESDNAPVNASTSLIRLNHPNTPQSLTTIAGIKAQASPECFSQTEYIFYVLGYDVLRCFDISGLDRKINIVQNAFLEFRNFCESQCGANTVLAFVTIPEIGVISSELKTLNETMRNLIRNLDHPNLVVCDWASIFMRESAALETVEERIKRLYLQISTMSALGAKSVIGEVEEDYQYAKNKQFNAAKRGCYPHADGTCVAPLRLPLDSFSSSQLASFFDAIDSSSYTATNLIVHDALLMHFHHQTSDYDTLHVKLPLSPKAAHLLLVLRAAANPVKQYQRVFYALGYDVVRSSTSTEEEKMDYMISQINLLSYFYADFVPGTVIIVVTIPEIGVFSPQLKTFNESIRNNFVCSTKRGNIKVCDWAEICEHDARAGTVLTVRMKLLFDEMSAVAAPNSSTKNNL